MLTIEKLRLIGAGAFPSLIEACDAYHIDTELRVAHFLAQCSHESMGFQRTVENLNYSAEALCRTWPKRFRMRQVDEDQSRREFADGMANAAWYHRKPEAIGNRAYANRMGNGNEASGDGFKYRGRGLIQLTGRNNIEEFSARYYGDDRLLADPTPLEREPLAAYAAGDFWLRNGCNQAADRDDLLAVTRIVNGGENGLDKRREELRRIRRILLP